MLLLLLSHNLIVDEEREGEKKNESKTIDIIQAVRGGMAEEDTEKIEQPIKTKAELKLNGYEI